MTQLVRGCFSAFTDCFYGSGEWSSAAAAAAAANAAAARAVPEVTLDTASMGESSQVLSIVITVNPPLSLQAMRLW